MARKGGGSHGRWSCMEEKVHFGPPVRLGAVEENDLHIELFNLIGSDFTVASLEACLVFLLQNLTISLSQEAVPDWVALKLLEAEEEGKEAENRTNRRIRA